MPFIRNRRQTLTNNENEKQIQFSYKELLANKLIKLNVFKKYNVKFMNGFKKIRLNLNAFKGKVKQKLPPQFYSIKRIAKEKYSPSILLVKNYVRNTVSSKSLILKDYLTKRLSSLKSFKNDIGDSSSLKEVDSSTQFKEWTDHSASLRQGRHWSSTIIALCSTMFVGSLVWAFTARIDQTITVRGRLQPSGSVREVESPSAGVVSKVYIKDGDVVTTGQPLFIVEAKGLASRRAGLSNTLAILNVQASSLRAIINAKGDTSKIISMPELPVIDDPDLSSKLVVAQQQSELILSQLSQIAFRLESRERTLKLQQEISQNLKPLYEVGAIARNQYLNKLNQVQEVRADVQSLRQEKTRILGQAAVQLNQLNTQLITLRSQLVEIGETLDYRTVKAPIDGKIFDTKVSPYSVVGGGSTVLKIVPDNRLEAAVKISNRDIGFVKTGMSVNVGVDSFPSGEFGYLEGTLKSIGSDALPPTRELQEYTFPATIVLKQQEVESGGKSLNLQSGMGVQANIKLRSRPVISIVTDLFTKQLEGVSRFR